MFFHSGKYRSMKLPDSITRCLLKCLLISLGVSFTINWVGCKRDKQFLPDPEAGLTTYAINYPIYFPILDLPADNPLTLQGIALGRQLYYDTILSNDGRACASCHFQSEGFSSYAANSLPHVNLGWHNTFLWNGGVEGRLEDAMSFEVNKFFHTNIDRLNQQQGYRTQFKKVFNTDTITSKHVAYALAQFTRSMTSFNSRIDRYMRHEMMLNFSELNGLYIFNSEKGECFHCHSLGLFHDNAYHNTGLDSIFTSANSGRYAITGNSEDIGKFKTPTLRNIALTSPYMHDGRYTTLEQVIEFYNSGVFKSATIDPIMTKPSFEHGLQLSTQEKADLLAFLNALTDTAFLNNPALSHP
jgi:cytochrome c peroxidase